MQKGAVSSDDLRRIQAALDGVDEALDRGEPLDAAGLLRLARGLSYAELPAPHRGIISFAEYCSREFADQAARHCLLPYLWAQVRTVVRQAGGKVEPSVFVADGARGLLVRGDLSLRGCPALTVLPACLSVGRRFDLGYCTGLNSLPDALTVTEDLLLYDCTALRGLPDDLFVGAGLIVDGCSDVVIKDAYRLKQAGRVGGEIFYNT
jgi:hypothetical protein